MTHTRVRLRLRLIVWSVFASFSMGTLLPAQPQRPVERRYGNDAKPLQQWSLTPTPMTTLGGADDGAQEFSMVTSLFRLPNGSLAIGLMSASEIRIFDDRGAHLRTLGRKGRGPGEFPILWRAYRVKDSIVGIDQAGIGQVFQADGQFVRSIPRLSAFGRSLERFGYFGDGSVLGFYYPDPLERVPTGTNAYDAMLVRATEGRADSLFRAPAGLVSRRGNGQPTTVAFAHQLQAAAFDDWFCLAASSDYVVQCYTSAGIRTLEIRRPALPARAITGNDRARFFEGEDRANPGPRAATYRREIRERTEFARARPQIGRLVASTAQELWVGSYDLAEAMAGTLHPSPEAVTTWHVYSARGEWLASLQLPARFRLFDAGGDWVAGVRRDENDVERVEVYGIRR